MKMSLPIKTKEMFQQQSIKELELALAHLETLLVEAVSVLERHNTSNHPSARPLISRCSPELRDWRGRQETARRKKADVMTEKWID